MVCVDAKYKPLSVVVSAPPATKATQPRQRRACRSLSQANQKEKPMVRKRNIFVVTSVAAAAALVGSLAIALWASTGAGSGRAASTTAVSITVNASTGSADLYPGFTLGDATFTLTNTNPYAITFTDMTTPGTAISSNPAACPNLNVTAVGKTGLSLVVAGNSTSAPLTISDVVTMISAAPDGCQGKTFDIALTLTGSQS
jgi:hypothetical protein